MQTYIALFRGINVGGHGKLPMAGLKRLLEQEGCIGVQTYIQSGNAVFRRPATDIAGLERRIRAGVLKHHGFEPRVIVLAQQELARAVAANPFEDADANPKSVHLFFLAERPGRIDWSPFETVRAKSERYELKGRVLYLHTPDGFGTSRLAERVERLLGVAATARNWRTVTTLPGMAGAAAATEA